MSAKKRVGLVGWFLKLDNCRRSKFLSNTDVTQWYDVATEQRHYIGILGLGCMVDQGSPCLLGK